jgi:hypothetical protein
MDLCTQHFCMLETLNHYMLLRKLQETNFNLSKKVAIKTKKDSKQMHLGTLNMACIQYLKKNVCLYAH